MSAVRIGICEWALPIQGPAGLSIAAECGFEGVEVEFRDHQRGFPLSKGFIQQRYLEQKAISRLEIPSIALNELDFCCMTGRTESEETHIAIETIQKGLETAHDMDIGLVQVPCFNNNDLRKQSPAKVCEVFQTMCDIALRKGIVIGAENVLPPVEMASLIKMIDRPNFKLYFDTQNYYLNGGQSTAEVLQQLYPYICEIHVKDGKHGLLSSTLLGEGEAGFTDTIHVLLDKGYSGWILVENYYDREPLSLESGNCLDLMKKDLETLRRVLH
jgi:2-epi-5-epi-valiolone 7-phosphate 2-epimerase